jgi:flagellar basal body-associated protein FliL
MNQDPNNPNPNSQSQPFQSSNPPNNQGFNPINHVHFSPTSAKIDSTSSKSPLDKLLNNNQSETNYQQPNYNNLQLQPNDQFGGYNPYQNSNNQNFQNFAPQDNFDTGFDSQQFNPNSDFNQASLEQYKSATPQFNANDPYLMPSTNPEMDDLDGADPEIQDKPQRDTKKILMFGLIGLIVVLLVASVALFFLSQNNKAPAVNNTTNSGSSKPTTQGLPATDKSTNSTAATDQATTVDTATKTGNPNTPASKAIVNLGATAVPNDWLSVNFAKFKGAVAEDGSCKLQNVCGPKVDPDKDGLNNLDEYIFAADPTNPDSDTDGLSDKDELYVYHSDPKNPDTNDNTYKDGVELANCYDPNIASQKLTKSRLNEISSSINKPYVSGLSPITQATLKAAGATTGELEKGYLTKCAITTASDSAVTPKATSNKNSTSPQRQPNTTVDVSTNEGS